MVCSLYEMSNGRVSGVTFAGVTRLLRVDRFGADCEMRRRSGGDEWTSEDADIHMILSSVWEYVRDRSGNGDRPKGNAERLRI